MERKEPTQALLCTPLPHALPGGCTREGTERPPHRAGNALTVLHEHVAVGTPVPGGLLLPCSLDEVQGGQTRPPLVPKNFSRLLPHKVRTGAPFRERVHRRAEGPGS